jgi:large subunit ribosomal protein L29
MKTVELRDKNELELNQLLKDLKDELFNLRFQHAINQLENPMRINSVKKDIARVMTVIKEKQLNDAQ